MTKAGGKFMAIYGIGYKYKDRKDVSKLFLDNSVACMNHKPEDFPYFVGLFNEIKEKDIIVLKTHPRAEKRLKIRAIGRANNPKPEKKGSIGYGISVNWVKDYQNSIKEIGTFSDGGFHQRSMAIYKEYNPKIIKQIIEKK